MAQPDRTQLPTRAVRLPDGKYTLDKREIVLGTTTGHWRYNPHVPGQTIPDHEFPPIMTDKAFKISVTPFDGSPEKLNTFLLQCEAQFDFNSDAFKETSRKIRFLLTKCEGGTAGPWAATWAANSLKDFVA